MAGMDRRTSERLDRFLRPFLDSLGRSERRKWGGVYVRGLMLGHDRRNPRRMAGSGQGPEQSLQQFVHQSPWGEGPLLGELARIADSQAPKRRAFVVDDTGFPKQGRKSVGVDRMYSGTLGKTGNCQIGVSLSLVWDDGAIPLEIEIYLPESWTGDPERLVSAGLPNDTPHRKKWEIALSLLDEAKKRGVSPGVVVADAGYGVVTEFREALRKRKLEYALGVQKTPTLWRLPHEAGAVPPRKGRGRPATRIRTPAESALALAQRQPPEAFKQIVWRQGTRGPLASRFAAVFVEPTHARERGSGEPETAWLLIEWPEGQKEPIHYWLLSEGLGPEIEELVYWVKIRWVVEKNYRDLKEELGLDHFEGRSHRGWRHHVSLTLVAHLFLTLEDLNQKKLYAVEPA
jgi:SRSO17 transposase